MSSWDYHAKRFNREQLAAADARKKADKYTINGCRELVVIGPGKLELDGPALLRLATTGEIVTITVVEAAEHYARNINTAPNSTDT